jgi:hypothetical protein
MSGFRLDRRALLRGSGVCLALPFLEAMTPRTASGASATPRRLLYYYTPCGWARAGFSGQGETFTFADIMSPLLPHRADMITFGGLTKRSPSPPRPNDNGHHEHAQRSALSQMIVEASGGAATPTNSTSADQIAAQALRGKTQFASLELGVGRGKDYPLAWTGPTQGLPRENVPRRVLERLVGSGLSADPESVRLAALRKKQRLSVIDFARDSVQSLTTRLGTGDRRRMDQYLTSLRDVEDQVTRAPAPGSCGASGKATDYSAAGTFPSGTDYTPIVRQMIDLMVLAFQCDLTRVISFMRGGVWDGLLSLKTTVESFGIISQNDEHTISHGNGVEQSVINRWDAAQFAYLLGKMKSTPDVTGNLLDNSQVLWFSDYSIGPSHSLNDPSCVLAGRGGGDVKPGRRIVYATRVPFANLLISMLNNIGVQAPQNNPEGFGNGTGPLVGLGG